jgi:hypothetical protein
VTTVSGEKTLYLEYVMQAMLLIVIVAATFVGMIAWNKWRSKRRQK